MTSLVNNVLLNVPVVLHLISVLLVMKITSYLIVPVPTTVEQLNMVIPLIDYAKTA
jgi:hypothetical protein